MPQCFQRHLDRAGHQRRDMVVVPADGAFRCNSTTSPLSAQATECVRAAALLPGIWAIRLLASQNFCASRPSPLTTPLVAQEAATG